MNNEEFFSVAFVIAAVCLAVFLIGRCGAEFAFHQERRLAVEAGVGKWEADPKTGVTRFYYGNFGGAP